MTPEQAEQILQLQHQLLQKIGSQEEQLQKLQTLADEGKAAQQQQAAEQAAAQRKQAAQTAALRKELAETKAQSVEAKATKRDSHDKLSDSSKRAKKAQKKANPLTLKEQRSPEIDTRVSDYIRSNQGKLAKKLETFYIDFVAKEGRLPSIDDLLCELAQHDFVTGGLVDEGSVIAISEEELLEWADALLEDGSATALATSDLNTVVRNKTCWPMVGNAVRDAFEVPAVPTSTTAASLYEQRQGHGILASLFNSIAAKKLCALKLEFAGQQEDVHAVSECGLLGWDDQNRCFFAMNKRLVTAAQAVATHGGEAWGQMEAERKLNLLSLTAVCACFTLTVKERNTKGERSLVYASMPDHGDMSSKWLPGMRAFLGNAAACPTDDSDVLAARA